MSVIGVRVTDKAGTRDDVEQFSRVQQKQQRAKDRALWHSEQEPCESRQLAFVGDLLTAVIYWLAVAELRCSLLMATVQSLRRTW